MLVWCGQQQASSRPPDAPLSVKEAAKLLNIGVTTMHRLLNDRAVPYQRIGKGRGTKRILKKDLLAYQQQAGVTRRSRVPKVTLEDLRSV